MPSITLIRFCALSSDTTLGGDYLDQVDSQGKEKRLVRQLEKVGFEVSLTPTSPAA